MKCLVDMNTIQIEITSACIYSCSNCSRFCGHQKPFFMTFEQFRQAADSMEYFPGMVGIMGGEPLLHPQFPEFCEYARSKFPREQLGLWTTFPKGYESYREIIHQTFGNIFLNDHSRPDIYHSPPLVAIEEVMPDPKKMFLLIDHCWLQNYWSASINPRGAFFCEVAASMSILFDTDRSWPVESDWFTRTPKDYTSQIEEYCPKCGCCVEYEFDGKKYGLPRRSSMDGRDDISLGNLKRLEGRSRKIQKGQYVVSDLQCIENPNQMAKYKEMDYRQGIANRYGMFLVLNDKGFCEPYLKGQFDPERKSIFEQLREKYKEERS